MATLPQRIRNFLHPPRPLSLLERLARAAERVPRLIKRGEHETAGWNYLRIADVADAFWGEVRAQGLLVIPNDLECHVEGNDAWVKTQFVVTDGACREEFVSFGQGRSGEGHALHIAQSTALKSWLKRLGMTFGEEDDQEVQVSPYNPPKAQVRQMGYQQRAWTAALATCGKTADQIESYLSTAFGFPVTSAEITGLSPENFDVAMQWLTSNGDLADTLEVSRRAAQKKGKGPQPVVAAMDQGDKSLTGD